MHSRTGNVARTDRDVLPVPSQPRRAQTRHNRDDVLKECKLQSVKMLMREMFVTGRDVLGTRECELPCCTRIHRKEDKAEQIFGMMHVIIELVANLRLMIINNCSMQTAYKRLKIAVTVPQCQNREVLPIHNRFNKCFQTKRL